MKLRNLKPIVFKEAVEFIHSEAIHIMNQLSKEHRSILKGFLDYRDFAERLIAERNFLHGQWQLFERNLALKSPVMEAEYAMDDRTALSLYDCLIPKLREHRKLKIRP